MVVNFIFAQANIPKDLPNVWRKIFGVAGNAEVCQLARDLV